jgi:hypothetical protein
MSGEGTLKVEKRPRGRKLHPQDRPAPIANALAYTLHDAARMTGLSVATLRRRGKDGVLELFKSGGRRLVTGPSLRRMAGAE